MFEMTSEEELQIKSVKEELTTTRSKLGEEIQAAKVAWFTFISLIKDYVQETGVFDQEPHFFNGWSRPVIKLFSSKNYHICSVENSLRAVVLLKEEKTLFLKKYEAVALIETDGVFSWPKNITKLKYSQACTSEIESLFTSLKETYKELLETKLHDKTVELETVKMLYPKFS